LLGSGVDFGLRRSTIRNTPQYRKEVPSWATPSFTGNCCRRIRQGCQRFYEKVFEWKVQHRPELNYRIVDTGGKGGINGGIIKPDRPEPWPGNTTFYIDVHDLAAYRKRVVAAGGEILIEEQESARHGPVFAVSRIPKAA
jgi:predicted enzyme related to lactoylglutathione lyase